MARFLKRLQASPPGPISQVLVPPSNVKPKLVAAPERFRAGQHYFTVRLTALHLEAGREWLTSYLPVVATACEFTYGTQPTAVPFVVGPSLVVPGKGDMPPRLVLKDTRVCSIHPYRGGEVSISAMLCRVVSDDKLARIVGMIEQATSVLNVATTVAPYLALVDMFTGTVDDLTQGGEAEPLLAGRLSLSADNGTFRPGYVLVTAGDVQAEETWLIDGAVRLGPTADDAVRLTEDHLLLSIEQADDRSDAESLPFIAGLWPKVFELAGRPDKESWSTAKTWLSVLCQELAMSPDLTRAQAEALYRTYVDRAVAHRDGARQLSELSTAEREAELQILRNVDYAVRAL